MLNDEKRGVEEAYTAAGNSSDLRVEADLRGDADLIIAAGWSESRVGMALLRLHSEWDKAEKPRKPSPDRISLLASTLKRDAFPLVINRSEAQRRTEKCEQRRTAEARRLAGEWYMHEMAKLVNKLKSLPEVRRALTAYVPKWGIQEAGAKVPAVIAYWLDQTCHQCDGLKFLKMPDAPSLSTKVCRACGGSGIAAVPHGQEGRRVANYMDGCRPKGRGSIRRNLSGMRKASQARTGWEKTGTRYTEPSEN